jgi:nucleotide-binding universal stress UspA family protein
MLAERAHIILVPIDSNDQSVVALGQSYNLARLTKSKILLLGIDDGHAKNIKEHIEELAIEAKSKTEQPVEIMIRKGDAYEEINKIADELRPMFIIIGIKRLEDERRVKNALQMIRKSKHPIISIGGKTHKDGCKKILMPLDLTVLSREKLPRTVEIAKLFNSAIDIVTVIGKEISKIEEHKLHMYANQCMKFIKENHLPTSCKFITIIDKQDIAQTVMEYGKKIDADLIVIVSDSDLSIKEYFTGTAAQRLISHSDIPVLTLRPIERRDTSQAVF